MRARWLTVFAFALHGSGCSSEPVRPDRAAPDEPVCPQLFEAPSPYVDLSCAARYCAGEARQTGCTIEVDAVDCGGGRLEGALDAQGDLRFFSTAELGACTPIEDADALVAAACEGGPRPCEVRAYGDGDEVAWSVRTLDITAGEPAAFLDRETPQPVDGWTGAFAVFEDRALVFDFDGAFSAECASAAGRVHLVDLGTLQITRTATAPPCVRLARVAPDGQRAFVLLGHTNPSVAEIDTQGHVRRSVPLDLPVEGAPVRLRDLYVGDEYVAVLAGELARDAPEYLSIYDVDTLQGISRSPPLAERTSMIQRLVSGELAVVNQGSSEMLVVDARTGEPGTQIALRQICGGRGHYDMVTFPAADAYALTSLRPRAEVRVLSDRLDACRTFRFLPARVDHTVVRPAPWAPRQLVVGAVEVDAPRAAQLALFDLDRGRFLRGTAHLGRGPLAQLQADARGRLWVSLPWAGAIARVALP